MYITFGHKMCGFKLFLLNFFLFKCKKFIYLFIYTDSNNIDLEFG